jgi:NAD dependent epimerase/dehydratase family enzyme
VTNREFTDAMSNVLVRPAILPMPAFAAKLAFGEMANELLLSGQRCDPERLRQTGFDFAFPEVRAALAHLLRGGGA